MGINALAQLTIMIVIVTFQVTASVAVTRINTGMVVRALVLVLATLLAHTMLSLVSHTNDVVDGNY